MNNDAYLKKRQALEALDYIDDDIISGVLGKIKSDCATVADTTRTWRTPLKYWKQFAALAACLILLSVASPLVSYVAEVISNLGAGAGSGTTGETLDILESDLTEPIETEQSFTTEIIETERPAVTDPIYQYVVTREEFDEMTEAWKIFRNSEKAYIVKDYNWFAYWYPCQGFACIYKKDADTVVFCEHDAVGWYGEMTVAGYLFKLPSMEKIWVYKDKNFYSLSQAYNDGILDEEDIKELSEIHHEHLYGENKYG